MNSQTRVIAGRIGLLAASSLLFLLLAGAVALSANVPYLVKDIRSGVAGSSPVEFVTIGTTTFFVADDGLSGAELWKTDGTTPGTVLVKDIRPGALGSEPFELTVVNLPAGDTVFFVADNGTNGAEIWKSDGTAAGTVLVKDIRPGIDYPGAMMLTAAVGKLFFRAHDGFTGVELWMSDGTAGGTVLVKDIRTPPAGASSLPEELTLVGNSLFFVATTTNEGRELWTSDGTAGGTVLVKDINAAGSSLPVELTAVELPASGNTLFFSALGSGGRELWKSDGTAVGTVRVKDIRPGYQDSTPIELTDVNGELFFVADDGLAGPELWKSDGSGVGTVLVEDIVIGAGDPATEHLTAAGGTLFFAADDGLMGKELWCSDGTGPGTFMVGDINTGAPSSFPGELSGIQDSLFFVADDGLAGDELWSSDGSGPGTGLVDDLMIGPAGSNPTDPTSAPSLVFFAADDGTAGRELWAVQFGAPVLELTKTFADDGVVVGSSGKTFTLTVTNSGSSAATSVRLTDSVDSRLTVTGVSPSSECSATGGQFIDCTFPSIGVGLFETVVVTYSVNAAVTPTLGVLNTADAGDGAQLVQANDTVDLLAPCAPLPVHLDVTDETIVSPSYMAEACSSISAGPTVSVMAGANATMRAGEMIVLNNGFEVYSGAVFTSIIDPLQSPQ